MHQSNDGIRMDNQWRDSFVQWYPMLYHSHYRILSMLSHLELNGLDAATTTDTQPVAEDSAKNPEAQRLLNVLRNQEVPAAKTKSPLRMHTSWASQQSWWATPSDTAIPKAVAISPTTRRLSRAKGVRLPQNPLRTSKFKSRSLLQLINKL